MTNPTCRDCGKTTGLVWGEKKDGSPILLQTRPHFVTCPKKRPAAGLSPEQEDAAQWVAENFKETITKARKEVASLEGDALGIIGQVLKRRDVGDSP